MGSSLTVRPKAEIRVTHFLPQCKGALSTLLSTSDVPKLTLSLYKDGAMKPVMPSAQFDNASGLYLIAIEGIEGAVEICTFELQHTSSQYKDEEGTYTSFTMRGSNELHFCLVAASAIALSILSDSLITDDSLVWSKVYEQRPEQLLSSLKYASVSEDNIYERAKSIFSKAVRAS